MISRTGTMSSANQPETPSQPDHCPACFYSREGLPSTHDCPECGCPLGEKWTYYLPRLPTAADRMRLRRTAMIQLSVGAGVFLLLAAYSLTTGGRSWSRHAMSFAPQIAFGAIGVWLASKAMRARPRPNLLAMSEQELAVISDGRRVGRHALYLITSLDWDAPNGVIRFRVPRQVVKLKTRKYLGGDYARINEFYFALRHAVDRAVNRNIARESAER